MLEAHGFETLQTKDGRQALELTREHKPDLIIMDIQLPEVSGLEVTSWIKNDDSIKHIPIIAVTAFAMKGDEEKMREGGCEAYIAKPISVTQFIDRENLHSIRPAPCQRAFWLLMISRSV